MSENKITVRYAETDDDVIATHRFLCVVAGPTLPGPIDGKKSITEVWRVAHEEVSLMAIRDDMLVGVLGLICVTPWWGEKKYLANRFFFTLPRSRAGRPLLKEAKAIAIASDMELHIISEERGKILILNRSEKRAHQKPSLANSPNSSLALAT